MVVLKRNQVPEQVWSDWNAAATQGCRFNDIGFLDREMPGWSVLAAYCGDTILAMYPIQLRGIPGFRYAMQPPAVRYNGFLFHPTVAEGEVQDSLTHHLVRFLMRHCRWYSQRFHPNARIADIGRSTQFHLRICRMVQRDSEQGVVKRIACLALEKEWYPATMVRRLKQYFW